MQEKLTPLMELWGFIKLAVMLSITWLAGTAGQIALAGAAGGVVRWWMSERKGLIRLFGSVFTGALFAQYFAPVALVLLNNYVGPLGDGAFASAAFAAGLGGMSFAKIIIAAIEGGARKLGAEHDKSN